MSGLLDRNGLVRRSVDRIYIEGGGSPIVCCLPGGNQDDNSNQDYQDRGTEKNVHGSIVGGLHDRISFLTCGIIDESMTFMFRIFLNRYPMLYSSLIYSDATSQIRWGYVS